MDQTAILDHQFVVAAYTVTWVIQLELSGLAGLQMALSEKRMRTDQPARSSPAGFAPTHRNSHPMSPMPMQGHCLCGFK